MKRIEVTWLDSAHAMDTVWHAASSTMKPVRVTSVGYCLERTKTKLVLVSGHHGGKRGQVAAMQCIPAGAIVRVRELTSVKEAPCV